MYRGGVVSLPLKKCCLSASLNQISVPYRTQDNIVMTVILKDTVPPIFDVAELGVDEGWKCSSLFPSQAAQCVTSISTRQCSTIQAQYIRTKDYPVDGERRVSQWLRYLRPGLLSPDRLYCEESNLVIGCRAGRCYGSPSSGEYGFYPGKWNTISIDGRKWGFEGGLSRQQQLEIWKAIKDGSSFAYQLVHWPYESLVTGSETLSLPKGLKDKIYRMSLEKP